jgi:ABC transport system ATP-binding/permease protein
VGTVTLQAQEVARSGRLVVEARGVSFARGDRSIVRSLSTIITRGDRVGLIGPNGSGKTTLLRLLLGELAPDAGTITLGTNLDVAYFDQLREQLDEERSVFDTIADGSDWVVIGGARKHVHGYLQEFLFGPERARTPVRALSGGERNRLLLARLFTRTFNLLVLDEPTNDLDIETLDLLEALLLEYRGTLLVVSHDRTFLDNVVTSTLAFEGHGAVHEYAGGYTDWLRQRPAAAPLPTVGVTRAVAATAAPKAEKRRKLTYRESQELAELPDRIDAMERERAALYAELADPSFLRNGPLVTAATGRLATLDAALVELTQRWEVLEEVAAGGA